jgi:hypothetical protein
VSYRAAGHVHTCLGLFDANNLYNVMSLIEMHHLSILLL